MACSRVGPSIKFRGFERDNKITEDCLDFFERTDSIRPSSPRLMFPRRSPSEVGLSCFRRVFLWRGDVQVLDMGWGFGIVAAVFRLVCCDEAPEVDLFCLRGFLLGETKV